MGRISDKESFIARAKDIHGDYYDYSLVEYKNGYLNVKLICPIHGVFEIVARSHITNGAGCRKCKRPMRVQSRGELISRNPKLLKTGQRQCSKCREFYSLGCFYKSVKTRDGLSVWCKTCFDKWKENYQYPPKTEEEKKAVNRKQWERYKEAHKEELEQKRVAREIIKRQKKIIELTARRLRGRIRDALKRVNADRYWHLSEVLGCDLGYFKFWIESQFDDKMNWDNYGYYGWHLDHIRPCASFDLTDPEQQKECFHYTNYRPLWRKKNQTKGSKYNGVSYRGKNVLNKK